MNIADKIQRMKTKFKPSFYIYISKFIGDAVRSLVGGQ